MSINDNLPDEILEGIFETAYELAMVVRTVCQKWRALVRDWQTRGAFLYWRDVHRKAVPDTDLCVELSIRLGLQNNIRYYCNIRSNHIMSVAAFNERLDILEMAHKSGCYWDVVVCTRAARYGHLNALKWAHKNGYFDRHEDQLQLIAARTGQTNVIMWLHEMKISRLNTNVFNVVVAYGHLEAAKTLYDLGCPIFLTFAQTIAKDAGLVQLYDWLMTL